MILAREQFPPNQPVLTSYPGQILQHAVAAVGALLLMEIVRARTRDDFYGQFRRSLEVIIGRNSRLATFGRGLDQHQIRLRLIVEVEPNA